MSITFSLAGHDDAEDLQSLWEQSHHVHYGPEYLIKLDTQNKNFISKHRRQFRSFFDGKMEDGQIFILHKENKPVGYTWLSLCSQDPDVAKLTEAFGVEKGIGRAVIKKAEAFAKENGRAVIELEAYEESASFYENMGYERQDAEGQRPGLVPYAKYI